MKTKSVWIDSLEDLKITIYQVHFIKKLDFGTVSLCIPLSKCDKLSFMMPLGGNTSVMKSYDLYSLCRLKDMSSAIKIASPLLKSLDIVILDLYVPHINAGFVFWDILSYSWSNIMYCFFRHFHQLKTSVNSCVWNRGKR